MTATTAIIQSVIVIISVLIGFGMGRATRGEEE